VNTTACVLYTATLQRAADTLLPPGAGIRVSTQWPCQPPPHKCWRRHCSCLAVCPPTDDTEQAASPAPNHTTHGCSQYDMKACTDGTRCRSNSHPLMQGREMLQVQPTGRPWLLGCAARGLNELYCAPLLSFHMPLPVVLASCTNAETGGCRCLDVENYPAQNKIGRASPTVTQRAVACRACAAVMPLSLPRCVLR
jgi:hypothetical protein